MNIKKHQYFFNNTILLNMLLILVKREHIVK